MNIKDERGAVILESTYCILISILVLMFMMSFGFFLYQKTIVTIVANEIAEEVTQTYKLRNVADSSSISLSDISGVGKYRYLFFKHSFHSKNKEKVNTLANVRLTKTSLAQQEDELDGLSMNIETVVDDIGRRHYKVTVKQKYSFMLGKLLKVINQQDVQILEETVFVESVDVLNYVNTVKVTKYGINKVKDSSAVLGLIDSTISLLHSIFDD